MLHSLRLSTREIPQADTLENVTDVVLFVSKGYDTYQMLAKKLGVTERQGRYYRLAAELLGFVKNFRSRNRSVLTPLGQKLLNATNTEKWDILFAQVFNIPAVQSVIGILATSDGSASRKELSSSLLQVVDDSTQVMMDRRLVTILSWLETLGIVAKSGHIVRLANLPNSVEKIEIRDPRMPVLPRVDRPELFREVSTRTMLYEGKILSQIERARKERTNSVHERLRSAMAQRIRSHGVIPTFNPYVDLAVRMNGFSHIIEARVLDLDEGYEIQNALSQLMEYRDIQCSPSARIVLLVNRPLRGEDAFSRLDYLHREKAAYLVWNEQDSLLTSKEGAETLPFMTAE